MDTVFRYATVLLCALFLAACKISTDTLGEGTIHLTSDNATPCASANGCYDGGFNRTVTFSAEPAAGYEFTGWAGDCEGLGECTVHTSGDRHVIATFKTRNAIVPLMQYTRDFFFSGPWPSDMRRKTDGTLDLQDFPEEKGWLFPRVKALAGSMQGFARNGTLYMPLASRLESVDSSRQFWLTGSSDDILQLINLNPASEHYLARSPLSVSLLSSDRLDQDSLLAITPTLPAALEANSVYGLVLFETSSTTHFSRPVVASQAMRDISANGSSGLLGQHWQQIRQHVANNTPFSASQVASFSVFTTQDNPAIYQQLQEFHSRFSDKVSLDSVQLLSDTSAYGRLNSCQAGDQREVQAFLFTADLPRFLSGKPPYLLQGGNYQYDSNGQLTTNGQVTRTTFAVVIPCTTAPDEGWPVEIVATGTGVGLNDRVDFEPDFDRNHRVVQVILPSPFPISGNDRQFPGGTENLSLLTNLLNLDMGYFTAVLADVNPLNLDAMLPVHTQYASDMLYALNFLRHYPNYLQQYSAALDPADRINDFIGLRINPQQIAFRGESLGGIAALHANAITRENSTLILDIVPRTNVSHINNLMEGVKVLAGENVGNAIAQLTGIDFPLDTQVPFAALLQTAIDPLDIMNRIPDLKERNLYLGMAEFNDALHGGEPSYRFAEAVGFQYPLTLIDVYGDPVEDYLGEWLRGDAQYYFGNLDYAGYGDTITSKPTRVLARSAAWSMVYLSNSFLYQMSTGQDLNTGLKIY